MLHFMRRLVCQLHKQPTIRQPQIFIKNINVNETFLNCRLIHTEDHNNVDMDKLINEICGDNVELQKKLQILMLEVDVMRQDGRQAPDMLQTRHWEHLLELASRNQRSQYLKFLWKTEKSKQNEKIKKEKRKKELETYVPESKEYPDDLSYGISHQTLFLRIRDKSINNFDNYRNLQSMINGQSIVIDCSYEDQMVWRETVNAAKQVTFVFGDNRLYKEPFNIHMCNVPRNGQFMKQLERNIPSLQEASFAMNIHECSYLDIFPKKNLVYLTPHCREELSEYDHDAVYIVGCMVDKVNNEPLSLARAKRDGIKMAKLPLDRYLEWAPGATKTLNINHVVPILLDLKSTGDWEYSLRHVPRRKLMETKLMAMQKKFKNHTLKDIANLKSGINKRIFLKNQKFKQHSLFDNSDKF